MTVVHPQFLQRLHHIPMIQEVPHPMIVDLLIVVVVAGEVATNEY